MNHLIQLCRIAPQCVRILARREDLSGARTFLSAPTGLSSPKYVTVALADDGSLAVAYLPKGGTIQVALGRLRGPAKAAWFDPATGKLSLVDGSPFANAGMHYFAAPGKNGDRESDWVLVIEAGQSASGRKPR